ncbi:MAG: NAD-binding protein, partial [Holophaga sp.]|nr:NAD-binding protein [Holophaga sp.]
TRVGTRAEVAHALKLGANLLTVAMVETLGEVLAFGEKAGFAPADYLRLLNLGLLKSPPMDAFGGLMVRQDYEPSDQTLDLAAKDLELIMRASRDLGMGLPMAAPLLRQVGNAAERGLGGRDLTALALVQRQDARLDEPAPPAPAEPLPPAPVEPARPVPAEPARPLTKAERRKNAAARKAGEPERRKGAESRKPAREAPPEGHAAVMPRPQAPVVAKPHPAVPPRPIHLVPPKALPPEPVPVPPPEPVPVPPPEPVPVPPPEPVLVPVPVPAPEPAPDAGAVQARVDEPRFAAVGPEGALVVGLDSTSHFEAVDGAVHAWVEGRRHATPWRSFEEVELAFNHVLFVRIQRTILLNPQAVLDIRSLFGGRARVRVAGGMELPATREAAKRLKFLLGE